MKSRFLLLVPFFIKKEALKSLRNFFNNTQVFHQLYSMLYTVNLGLHNCVGFLQIRSHLISQYLLIFLLVIFSGTVPPKIVVVQG